MMKHTARVLALFVCLSILLSLSLVGCQDETPPESEGVFYTVTFDSNGGSAVPSMTVAAGSKIEAPDDPVRDNYIFDGWMNGTAKWVFSYDNVNENVTLKASWKSSADVFEYEAVEGTEDAILTSLKSEHATLLVPSTINGFHVVGLAERMFAELSSEKVGKIIVPDSVTRIGKEAFAESADIEIVIQGTLTEIGESAFRGCTGLQEIRLADGMAKIAYEAFAGSGLTHISLPSSLRVIEENAFLGCASLRTLVIHETLAATDAMFAIEDSAFHECAALKTVFLYGAEDDQAVILARTADQNAPFREAAFCYYSEEAPTGEGNYWYMHDGEPRVW